MLVPILLALALTATSLAQNDYVIPPISGTSGWQASLDKARALVSQMTVEEKLSMTQQGDNSGRVGTVERLGYDGVFYADGPEGIRGWPFASAVPMALNTSFDRDAMYKRAVAIGQECHTKGINVIFGPGVNLMRTPQAGRAFEYSGADPYLAGVSAEQHVKGVQSQQVMAMMRHFIGNEQESGRTTTSSNMDERTAHELYIWPYHDAIHAGVVSGMCSYNGLNGTHACGNPVSLGRWLHDELDFQGWMLSDCNAVALDEEVQSANSGLDSVICGTLTPPGYDGPEVGNPFGLNSSLARGLEDGSLSQDRLTDMAERIVAAWYQIGQDRDFPPLDTQKNALKPETNDLIREIGAKTIVLLKNENNVLPIKTPYVYVFGQSATVDLYGFPHTSRGFAPPVDQGTFPGGYGASYANLPYLITPFEALQERARQSGSQVYGWFDNYNHTSQAQQAAAAERLNATCLVDVRQVCGEGFDRQNLSASWEGDATIQAVASACTRTVVVYSACGPFDPSSWKDHPNVTSVLNVGGLGQEAGHAVVDVLYGDHNPSAKLPYTVGYQLSDYAAVVDFNDTIPINGTLKPVEYTEGLFIDYRWFDQHNITPAYEFGYGLSYTTFSLSNLQVEPTSDTLATWSGPHADELWDCLVYVSIDVTNTGDVYGCEVPQLYLGSPAEGAPVRVLRGFDLVSLAPGETKTVGFNLSRRDFSSWSTTTSGWKLAQGQYGIHVGTSSRDLQYSEDVSFTLS